MYQPLAFMVMQRFLHVGFTLKEDIIKHQHNCKATGFWVKKLEFLRPNWGMKLIITRKLNR